MSPFFVPPNESTSTPFLEADYTALTAVQPTYMAPYDENGIPMRCELTLTFKELPPVYSDSF